MTPVSFERTLASAKRTMVLSEIVRLAVDSFLASKVRFALTALGMVIGSASLILVVTIGLTGKEYVLSLLQSIGTNMIVVDYQGASNASISNTQQDFLTYDDMRAVQQQVSGVVAASPMLEIHDSISIGNGVVRDMLVLGVAPDYRIVRNLKVLSGRFFDSQDDQSHAKVAVITPKLALALYGSDQQAIGQSFSLSGIPFTVIGVFRESVDTFGTSEIADQTILIPYPVARYFTGTDNVKQLFFSMSDSSSVPTAGVDIQHVIQSRHRPGSVYNITTLTAVLTVAGQIADALTLVLLLVAAITLIVSGVGIMNIMLANVRSRIREIGIRKAVGATYREIQLQFLIEAIFISLAGGFIGVILGLSVPVVLRIVTGYDIPISIWSVVIALTTATIVGVTFGTLPATRAAQLDPVEALKYE
jgi:putative ABC transport system permease protein